MPIFFWKLLSGWVPGQGLSEVDHENLAPLLFAEWIFTTLFCGVFLLEVADGYLDFGLLLSLLALVYFGSATLAATTRWIWEFFALRYLKT